MEESKKEGLIGIQEGNDMVFFKPLYCDQYSMFSEPKINDLEDLVNGFLKR